MQSLGPLSATEALARFGRHVDEVTTDELTGTRFRRIIFATTAGDDAVHLTVSVSPEPVAARRARRFKLIADFMEGWRGARESREATRVIKR